MEIGTTILKRTAAASVLSFVLVLSSCDVHEFPAPSPEPQRQLTVELNFDHELPFHVHVEYDDKGNIVRTRNIGFERRYIIKAYASARGELSRNEEASWIFTRDSSDPGDATFVIDMPEGDYNLMVWSDFIDAGQGVDKHYNTTDFSDISLLERENHHGSDETRDSFRGTADVSATDSYVNIAMGRPLARYTFISTDLDAFLESRGHKVKEDKAFEVESEESKGGDGESRDPGRAIDLSGYGVRFTYPQYMPNSFNMFTNRPADSWTGVSYESDLKVIDNQHAQVGFDYVFVNSHDTSINVGLEIYDRLDGTVLARTRPIDVPLSRSRHTIVSGPFLTTTAGGSAGINPDYDGDINVWIH